MHATTLIIHLVNVISLDITILAKSLNYDQKVIFLLRYIIILIQGSCPNVELPNSRSSFKNPTENNKKNLSCLSYFQFNTLLTSILI